MSRNYQACWTCRIRRKGHCQGPSATGDCSICIELNVECLQGYGERLPREYRRPEIVEELSKWNRRKSSRFAPEKFMLSALLERVLAAEAVQNAPTPAQAGPSIAPIFPGSSPSVSSESSSIFSTLPSTRANIENPQESPVYTNTPLSAVRGVLKAYTTHQQPQSSPRANLLPEITSDYTVYLSQLTPPPQLSDISRSPVDTSPTLSAPMSALAIRSDETATSSGSTEGRRGYLGTEGSTGAYGSAPSSSSRTSQASLRRFSSQADTIQSPVRALGGFSSSRSAIRPTPSIHLGPGIGPDALSAEASMSASFHQSLPGSAWPTGEAYRNTPGSFQYYAPTSAPTTLAQPMGTGVNAQEGLSSFSESNWSIMPTERQSSTGSAGQPNILASSEMQRSSASEPVPWYDPAPYTVHARSSDIEAATAQYIYLQQHRNHQLTNTGPNDHASDPSSYPFSQKRTNTFRGGDRGT